jgi:hypothetical protein
MFTAEGCAVGIDSAIVQKEQDAIRKEMNDPASARVFKVTVSSKHLALNNEQPVTFNLPAGENVLNEVMRSLRINSISEGIVVEQNSPMDVFDGMSVADTSLEILNDIAGEIEYFSKEDGELSKFLAAVEIESPADFNAVHELIRNLDQYELMPEDVQDCESYAKYIIFDSGEVEDIRDEIEGYMDYDEYGKDRMREEGIRETAFGLLRRLGEPFPEENHVQGMSMNQ